MVGGQAGRGQDVTVDLQRRGQPEASRRDRGAGLVGDLAGGQRSVQRRRVEPEAAGGIREDGVDGLPAHLLVEAVHVAESMAEGRRPGPGVRYDVRRACGWLRNIAGRMVRANPRRYGLGCPVPEVFAPEIESAPSGTTGAEDPAKEAA
jgi:hypothetical protein